MPLPLLAARETLAPTRTSKGRPELIDVRLVNCQPVTSALPMRDWMLLPNGKSYVRLKLAEFSPWKEHRCRFAEWLRLGDQAAPPPLSSLAGRSSDASSVHLLSV